jgi:hypothetical protein
MTDDVIGSATSEEQAPVTPVVDATVTVLDTMVGEGRQYSNTEELAKGRAEADTFIEQLKFENGEMRSTLAGLETEQVKAKTIADVLEAMNQPTNGEGADNQDALKPEDIQGLITEALQKERSTASADSNRDSVNAALLTSYGDKDKAATHVREKLKDLGLDGLAFKRLSETAPAAALRILDITKTRTTSLDSPTGLSDLSTEIPVNPSNTRNHAYYTTLRKEMGKQEEGLFAQLEEDAPSDSDAALFVVLDDRVVPA